MARQASGRRAADIETTQRIDPSTPHARDTEPSQTLELREEEIVAHKELQEIGEVTVRTEIEEVPGRLEVDAHREEVEVEHEPIGRFVTERREPWEEDGVLVVPIYEEQLVVSKRLMLKEQVRIRRVPTTERQLFEDTLRRERLVIEDPQHTGLVHEQFPNEEDHAEPDRDDSGLLERVVRRALE